MTPLPAYLEFGGRATSPGPFLCEGGQLRGLVLETDGVAIKKLIKDTLDKPGGRGLEFREIGSHVLLLIGPFAKVSCTMPPFDTWGYVEETQVSIWVPVASGRNRGPIFIADRIGLAMPYMLVDNPMSYAGGREDYGYAKTMGRFDPQDARGENLRVKAFGGNFGVGVEAKWKPLLEIHPTQPAAADPLAGAPPWKESADVVRFLVGNMFDDIVERNIGIPGLQFPVRLAQDLMGGRPHQFMLKQFRDAADGRFACYQSVTDAPIRVTKVSGRPSRREWEVKIHHLDSHPIAKELGLKDQQTTTWTFSLDIDFTVEQGVERVRRAVPGGGPGNGGISFGRFLQRLTRTT